MKISQTRLLIILIVIGLLSILPHLYHFSWPIADWHSWRQVDTAAVARNFLKFGVDPLHPRYDDLSNIQSGLDNPKGWRMVEFPLYQLVAVYLFKAVPHFTIEEWLRIISIGSTAASIVLMGYLLSCIVDPLAGIIGALMWAFLPFCIYYGRTILPDIFARFWTMLSLTLLWLSSEKKKSWILVLTAAIAGSISVLVRPMEIFILTPGAYFLVRNKSVKESIARLLVYGTILSVPLLLWRRWIAHFPEGIPTSAWLYDKDNIRLKGAWFYWLFANRLGDLILGYWGLIPFGIGLIAKSTKKDAIVSILWLLGGLAYFIVFAGGNVQHDYYQITIIPIVIWFSAKGLYWLVTKANDINRIGAYTLAIVSVVFMFAFSWYTLRTFFWINHPEIVEAGKAADKLLPKNAKVIAPYSGDTTFLYQTNRQGWPIGFDIDKKMSMGAQYYVTVSPLATDGEANRLASQYTVMAHTDHYTIIDLTKPKKAAK